MSSPSESRPAAEVLRSGMEHLRRRFAPILAALPVQDTDEGVFDEIARETAGLDHYRREANSCCL